MANITIYELAKELNMTPSMVSRAFNPNGKINEEKRKLVLETAKKYNFSPNKFASRLSMRTIRIGILIRSGFKINSDKMVSGIKSAYELLKDYKIKYDITVFQAGQTKLQEYEEVLLKYAEYDGIIVAGLSSRKYTPIIKKAYKINKNIVHVHGVNTEADYLFASKHSEETAANLAGEFLYNSLKYSDKKGVVLFTGDRESSVHLSAEKFFKNACEKFGLNILESVDMKDDAELLKSLVSGIFQKYDVKGIYITSGVSAPLCKYLEENKLDIPLVGFDTYSEIKEYLEKGIFSATIAQNIGAQMENAFELLVKYIINGEKCDKTVYTDVQLVLKSNMHQFE